MSEWRDMEKELKKTIEVRRLTQAVARIVIRRLQGDARSGSDSMEEEVEGHGENSDRLGLDG